LPNGTTVRGAMTIANGVFSGPRFVIPYNQRYAKGGAVVVTVRASDSHGALAKPYPFSFRLDACALYAIPR
jgi:hypothetical protein